MIEDIMQVLVINLDRDKARYAAFESAVKDVRLCSFERISAVDGKNLPAFALAEVSKSEGWATRRGEIGCFLSHVKAWEFVSRNGMSLIVEDDAVPLDMERLSQLAIPEDVELIFANDRAAAASSKIGQPLECCSVLATLATLERTRRGVGGDGYILSPTGASKLLSAIRKDGCFGHVDWRLLRYSVNEKLLVKHFPGTRVAEVLMTHHHPSIVPQWNILNARCLNFPIVAAGNGASSREEANN